MLACLRQVPCRTLGSRVAIAESLSTQLAAQTATAARTEYDVGVISSPCSSGRCSMLGKGTQQRHFFDLLGLNGDLSKSYHERKLIGYSPRQMYEVVADVEKYHFFVPWCVRSTVKLRRPPTYLEAELEVGFQMFVERYTSKVTLHSPVRIESRVEDSTLFHHLTNKWEFRPGPSPSTCWLSFDVDFAFKSPLYRQIASVFFEEVVQRMIGAFEGRCRHLYGPSSLHAKHAVGR